MIDSKASASPVLKKFPVAFGVIAATSLALSACAGSVGQTSDSSGGEGVSPGASIEDYTSALADMPATTLVYQPSAASENARDAFDAVEFKKNVEKASGGKITIDLVYGQAIAGFPEIADALVDGRLDIAFMLPLYEPSKYPVTNAFIAGTTLAGTSPRAEELVADAALLEVAWNTPELIEEFESKGLRPLVPLASGGGALSMCTEPGSEGWDGRQIRVSNSAQDSQVSALGASPVSIAVTETYEALQRGTVDCTLSAAAGAVSAGITELTPHVSYPEGVSFGRGSTSVMAGSKYAKLPLAAQQLIFDQMAVSIKDRVRTVLISNAEAAQVAAERGGSIKELGTDAEKVLADVSERLVDEQVEKGVVPQSFKSDLRTSLTKWRETVNEMGLGDEGGFEDMHEWHDDAEVDLTQYYDLVYEEILLDHRPS